MKLNLKMRKLTSLLVCLCATALQAATPNVRVTVTDFCDTCSGIGNTVQLTPGATVAAADPANLSGLSDGSAQITFSSLPAGFYRLGIAGVGQFQLYVPGQSGTLEASDLVISQWDRPKRASTVLKSDIFRGVPYLWPPMQGSSGTVLTNDGSGNLGWGAGSGGAQVWTNDSGVVAPVDDLCFHAPQSQSR